MTDDQYEYLKAADAARRAKRAAKEDAYVAVRNAYIKNGMSGEEYDAMSMRGASRRQANFIARSIAKCQTK